MRERLARGGIYAGAFLGPFGGGVTVAMLPELGATFGVSAATAATTVTAYLLPFAVLMLISGTLGEGWGRRRTVVGAYCLYVVAALASVLVAVTTTSFTLFLVTRALQGVANAFTTPLLLAALAASAPDGRLGRALGWFGSLQAAGQTSAPLLGGLAAELDWRLAFVGVASVAAALGVVGIPAAAAGGAGRPSLRTAWRFDVVRIGIVAAVGWGALAGLNFLVALRLEEQFAVAAGTRGLVLTGLGVVGLLSARLVGGAVDRIGPRRSVLLGAATAVAVVVGVGIAPTVWTIALIWAVGGLASQLVLVGVNATVLAPGRENPSGAMSVVQAVRFGGGALAPVAITPIYHADPLTAFLVPAATIAVLVPAALPRPPRPKQETDRAATP